MRRQNVDVLRRINHFALPIDKMDWLNMVSPRPLHRRALDLHPPQPPPRIQHKVIALTVAPGLGHPEPEPHRLMQKRRLRKLPVRLLLRCAA